MVRSVLEAVFSKVLANKKLEKRRGEKNAVQNKSFFWHIFHTVRGGRGLMDTAHTHDVFRGSRGQTLGTFSPSHALISV